MIDRDCDWWLYENMVSLASVGLNVFTMFHDHELPGLGRNWGWRGNPSQAQIPIFCDSF